MPALLLAIVLASLSLGIACASDVDAHSAAALQARYEVLRNQLTSSPFQKPLHLISSESADSVAGDIHALVSYPFATVSAALKSAGNWCDILILHLNVKYCRASTAAQGSVVNVSIGKKYDQPLHEAYRVDFAYRVAAHAADYLQVRLNANEGPLGTHNYSIVLEAVPLQNEQTFIRLSYSYAYGPVGRLAMQAYLATVGRDKVGFTVAGTQPDGRPLLIRGMRGLVERNTMRYYLAIEAYLGALSTPAPARFEKSLHDWFAAVERYPLQLHELERDEYLAMKRREKLRQK